MAYRTTKDYVIPVAMEDRAEAAFASGLTTLPANYVTLPPTLAMIPPDAAAGLTYIKAPRGTTLSMRFVGTDADNEIMDWKIVKFTGVPTGEESPVYFTSSLLMQGTATLSSALDATPFGTGAYGADTIAVTATAGTLGAAATNYTLLSVADDDHWAELSFNVKSASWIGVFLKVNAGATAAKGQVLFGWY